MNNISYPENWGKKEIKYAEIHWRLCSINEPSQKDVYLVTISNPGIKNFTMVADWLGDMWSVEHIGNVIAWSYMPEPYSKN